MTTASMCLSQLLNRLAVAIGALHGLAWQALRGGSDLDFLSEDVGQHQIKV